MNCHNFCELKKLIFFLFIYFQFTYAATFESEATVSGLIDFCLSVFFGIATASSSICPFVWGSRRGKPW